MLLGRAAQAEHWIRIRFGARTTCAITFTLAEIGNGTLSLPLAQDSV